MDMIYFSNYCGFAILVGFVRNHIKYDYAYFVELFMYLRNCFALRLCDHLHMFKSFDGLKGNFHLVFEFSKVFHLYL